MTQPPAVTQPPAADGEYRKRGRSKAPLIIAIVAVGALIAVGISVFALNRTNTDTVSGNTLTTGVVLEPTSLDVRTNTGVATSQILLDNVYQGLVGIAPGTVAEIVPVLATELPQVSADGLEYRFTLRDDVTFHTGSTLTAQDVVSSLEETLTTDNVGYTPEITDEGDNSVTITLEEPNSQLLWHLANFPGVIREDGASNNLAHTARGPGPYPFEQWKQGDSLTLVKNDEYWGTPATLDTAVFRFFPDGRAAVNALHDGDLDVHTALLPPLREEFENDANFTLERADSSDVFTLAYNSDKTPLSDPRVRTALSLAIDTDAIITAQSGDGKPLGSPITELEPGYRDLTSINAYDPEAARALLAEAGQPNLSLTTTAPNHYDTTPRDLTKSQLADVGVSIKIKQVEFPTWLEEVYTNHDFQLSYVDHAEARDFGNYANPDYYFGYDSAKVQDLYGQSLATTDTTVEGELLEQAASQVAADAPAKWLFNYTPTNVIGTHVSGFPAANTNSRINLEGVTLQ